MKTLNAGKAAVILEALRKPVQRHLQASPRYYAKTECATLAMMDVVASVLRQPTLIPIERDTLEAMFVTREIELGRPGPRLAAKDAFGRVYLDLVEVIECVSSGCLQLQRIEHSENDTTRITHYGFRIQAPEGADHAMRRWVFEATIFRRTLPSRAQLVYIFRRYVLKYFLAGIIGVVAAFGAVPLLIDVARVPLAVWQQADAASLASLSMGGLMLLMFGIEAIRTCVRWRPALVQSTG